MSDPRLFTTILPVGDGLSVSVRLSIDRDVGSTRVTVAQWLSSARADAERRGLPDLVPVLESLAGAITALRARTPGSDGPPDPERPTISRATRQPVTEITVTHTIDRTLAQLRDSLTRCVLRASVST